MSLFAHGTIYSFLPGGTHELSHGTVFKTKWLNGLFVRFLSLISWFNFHDYKMSHTYHHLYTLHPRGDREVVLPNNPSLHPLYPAAAVHSQHGRRAQRTVFLPDRPECAATVKLAFSGKIQQGMAGGGVRGQEEARQKSINWARLMLLFHAAVIAVSIVFRLWPLPSPRHIRAVHCELAAIFRGSFPCTRDCRTTSTTSGCASGRSPSIPSASSSTGA